MKRLSIPFRISVIYLLVGCAWIALSGYIVAMLSDNVRTLQRIETLKGWFFVFATAGLLHYLINQGVKAIRSADLVLRDALEAMTDPVLVIDHHGDVVHANQAAIVLLGVPNREALLRPLATLKDLFQPSDENGQRLRPATCPIYQVLEGRFSSEREIHLRRPERLRLVGSPESTDGGLLEVHLAAEAVRPGRHGKPEFVVVVLRDVTLVKRLERMRDEFLSVAAHELRTPVTIIKANAQLLRKPEIWTEDGRKGTVLGSIDRQCSRIARLIEQLLEITGLERGLFKLARRPFELGELVREVVARMKAAAGPGRPITILQESDFWVDADRDRIEQVLSNLLDNAIRFSPHGGAIGVSIFREQGQVVFSIQDHGLGIPADRQGHVFQRYYRAHAGTADDFGGMGIGLHLNREIVLRHGGKMWFQSLPGKGSVFSFSLPEGEAVPQRKLSNSSL